MRLVWRPSALIDLEDIWAYSERQFGTEQTAAYVRGLQAKAGLLATGDLSGTAQNDVEPGLRRQLAGSHAIWFRVDGDVLRVIRVLHQSRDVGRWVA